MNLQEKMYDVLLAIDKVISTLINEKIEKNDTSEDRFLNELIRESEEGEQLLQTLGVLEVCGYLTDDCCVK